LKMAKFDPSPGAMFPAGPGVFGGHPAGDARVRFWKTTVLRRMSEMRARSGHSRIRQDRTLPDMKDLRRPLSLQNRTLHTKPGGN
jgi:hypothetical protein